MAAVPAPPPAVEVVAARARTQRASAAARIERAAGDRLSSERIADLAAALPRCRMTLNFHPDRLTATGTTVARGLLERGRYVSQFVTGISSGGRFAVAGGARDDWERQLFGDAYRGDVAVAERPVYGALDVLRDPHGGSPRFGSCFVVLHPHVARRATWCVGDSHLGPTDVGTADEPMGVLAGLVEQAVAHDLLGRALGLDDLVAALSGALPPRPPDRALDGYIEAQVHGGVSLTDDVERVVLDPSFADTDVEAAMTAASARFGFLIDWHGGSELRVDDVPDDMRGPTMPDWARRAAGGGATFDAAAIGRVATTLAVGAPSLEGDPPDSDLQQVKYLWHVLLALGHDRPR